MELAFNYTAKTLQGSVLNGVIYSKNKALGYAKLKRSGFLPLSLKLSIGQTVSGWLNKEFNAVELSRFYRTLGRRMDNGKPIIEGLEAALDYVQDQRLRQAVMVLKQAILDGQNEFQAMAAAGFPKRDSMVVRSTAEAGKTGAAFQSLGQEIARVENLRKNVAAIFRMPSIMAVGMAIAMWAAILFVAPMTMSFLKQTNLKLQLNPFILAYFDFAKFFGTVKIFGSIMYFGTLAGIAYFVKSDAFKKFLDHFKTLRTISMKADLAALWNSFTLLYGAAVPVKEAAKIVAEAAKRQDSKDAFIKLGKIVESGRSLDDASESSGFPIYIVAGVKSALSAGATEVGLLEMVQNLEEDVATLTEILTENIKLLSILMVGLGVLAVFVVTYYPILASVMGNL